MTHIDGSIRRAALAFALAAAAGGCDGIFDVENPNQLVQEDLERAQAASALVNGAEATVARALGYLLVPLSLAGDELTAIGTLDSGVELDAGFVANPVNEFSNNAFPFVAEARFQSDEAIRLLEGFDAAGTLPDRAELARAYLYGGVIYTAVADAFDDFVISDRTRAAPPLGEARMVELYDRAAEYLGRGLDVAREVGRADLEVALLAQRARALHARAVWTTLNPAGSTPARPLVADPGATADALAALSRLPEPDWALRFGYGAGTVGNQVGSLVNVRQEFRVDTAYAVPTMDGKRVAGVRLLDPVEGVPDAALDAVLDAFLAGGEYPSLTVVSARELRLIVAEAALAAGDDAEGARQLDAVRALDGRAPGGGRIDAAALLRHERRVGLFLQGRRLADLYRFGEVDPRWQATADTRRPGTFLPITENERISNCHIVGTCGG
ncbi:MAG: hypothetical protein KY453_03950 [Gemmatimonadetes bacterium]|nr:hypothetical protein [Gemmatimonadota bacterium]